MRKKTLADLWRDGASKTAPNTQRSSFMSGICSKKSLALLAAVLGLSAATATQAATKIWDFNTDPSAEITLDLIAGTTAPAKWVSSGGVGGSGYLSITDAANGVGGTALFPDIDAGAAVTGFTLNAQVRIGGGTARPADGLSINWITAGGDSTLSSGEEGVNTGVAISLDTWDNNVGDSAPSIEAKLNQRILAEADSVGQREGGRAFFGPTTYDIQTGASFVPIKVVYKNSLISVTYKGVELIKGAYAASTAEAKQLFVAARTGNANENHWLDDVSLTTYTDANSYVTRISPDPTLPHGMGGSTVLDSTIRGDAVIEFDITDGTASTLNNASVVMKVDGTAVTPTFTKSGSVTTVSFDPPGLLPPGSSHTVDLSFNAGSETSTASYSFWVSPLTANTLFVEAEDLNYDGGQHKAEADVIGYTGEAYAGLSAVAGVDYNDPGTVENAAYRTDISVSMTGHGEVTRYDHDLTANYKVGWNDAGDWYNYTRVFAPHAYRVLARHSSGGNDTHTKLSIVGGATTSSQTVFDVGNFDVPASNGWDTFRFVELKDSAGNPVIVNLSGEQTVRLTIVGGNEDFNYLAFIPVASGGATALASVSPGDNGVVNPLTSWTLQGSVLDQSVTVDPASLNLSVNGTPVTETATKANGISAIIHPMPVPGYGAVFTVKLEWTENGSAKSKTVTIRAGGGVTRRIFSAINGTAVTDLLNAQAYLDNAPDIETLEPWFETPANVDNNYGVELLSYFTPTVTGDYAFHLSADDNAVLYLSTDDQPYNKVAIPAKTAGTRPATGLVMTAATVWPRAPRPRSI